MSIRETEKPQIDRRSVMQLLTLAGAATGYDTAIEDIELPFPISSDALELYKHACVLQAREDFWAFRQYINPEMLTPWWQRVVATNLMDFWNDYKGGQRPKLLLQSPPQMGKSEQMMFFSAWLLGKDPSLRIIYASYSDTLGTRFNLGLQRLLTNPRYQEVFPGIKIGFTGWLCNTNFIEIVGCTGSFRNTTVGGGITGQGLDIGIVDDPVKGRAEASSKNQRDRTWEWFTDDFFSRFSNQAGVCEIQTRWHVDDIAGRWINRFPETRVLKFKAIATEDERFRKKGEALFPELKPLDFLLEHKKALSDSSWESLYQQSPYVVGGGLFPIEKLLVLAFQPARSDILKSVRAFDKAGTEDGGAYTAGVLMHKMKNGMFVIEDVIRGQWGALEREQMIKAVVNRDTLYYSNYEVVVEQEPGPIWEDELVRMSDGNLLALKNVNVGDEVIGKSGKSAIVTAAFDRGNLLTLKIETESGRIIHSALDHPFLTPYGWIKAKALTVGDVLAHKTTVYTTPTSACLAGYFVAFGQQYLSDEIVGIEMSGAMPCRCISVEGEESFIVNDFVVHNSGGKESVESTIRNLAGFCVYADKVTGSKEARADPFAAQVQGGNVWLIAGAWHSDFFEEIESFPNGRYKDQTDASVSAFNRLVGGSTYSLDSGWLD